ncbi:hypothetical protein FACS189461_2230 [Spirochaetia bacterium]|nr:hypothetical protein FACS189461_2230 [Spirochaetia bacterium]
MTPSIILTRAIASFFKTRAVIKFFAIIFVFFALVQLVKWIPTLQVKRGKLPERIHPVLEASEGLIPTDAGITLAAENGGRKMYVEPETMNIRIEDTATGFVWNALRPGDGTASGEEQSIIKFVFISEDDVISRWDSYTYSLKQGAYTLERIKNGVRMNLQIGNADPTDINAFMPRRIAIERYEEVFIKGLERKTAQGELTDAEAGRYKSVLGLIFAIDEEKGYYYNQLRSSPPGSAVKQMLTMTRLLGYTVEQLNEDEAPYDLPAEDRRPPVGFFIPLDFTLEDGDLVANVSTEHIETQNPYYTLTQIIMLPNFGSVSYEECEAGYMFVPDGSGALIAMNSFDTNYSGYERPLYANTIFRDKAQMPQFPEDLSMPVFGMIYEGSGGFMGIIERGDETAFVGARTASARTGAAGGTVYNSVYTGFDAMQYQQTSIAGADTNGGSYTVGTGMLDMDFTVRYKLFPRPVSYFDMASVYKRYLTSKYGLVPNYDYVPKIYLDVTAIVSVEGRFLGNYYERKVSMTSYSELAAILKDLGGIPKVVSYSGVFNGGSDNKLANRVSLVPQNGTKKELAALQETARQTTTELFMGTNIARVYRKGNGFDRRAHSSQGYDGEPAFFWGYDIPLKTRKYLTSWYTQLNPLYLQNVISRFLAASKPYHDIYVNDLGADYYASYKRNALVPPLAAREIINNGLASLAAEKKLALNNPAMDKILYAAYAVNLSRESSNYGGFYTSVPFRQLTLNGLTGYTTLDANNRGKNRNYYLLQALELGSFPKYSITAKNADPLKYTDHTEFLSTQYTVLRDDIKALYGEYQKVFAKIGRAEIVNHETLSDGVYVTTYGSGVSVTVNYNPVPALDRDGTVIPPLGYSIREAD